MKKLDLMVFGAHPDDTEIGAGGTIAVHTHKGYSVGICDLTEGELSTNGSVEIRQKEAEKAAKLLKVEVRENVQIPDGFVEVKEEYVNKLIELIRKYRPGIILAPYYEDHHPDHINASRLVKKAAHLSGLKEYPVKGERYRPSQFYYYFLGYPKNPNLVVDTTPYEEQKLESIAAHESQLGSKGKALETRLTRFDLIKRIEARDRYMGYFIDAEFGEGLTYEKAVGTKDLFMLGGVSEP